MDTWGSAFFRDHFSVDSNSSSSISGRSEASKMDAYFAGVGTFSISASLTLGSDDSGAFSMRSKYCHMNATKIGARSILALFFAFSNAVADCPPLFVNTRGYTP